MKTAQNRELRNTKLEGKTVSKFFMKNKSVSNSLCAIGESISHKGHVDVISEGFPSEYESLVNDLIEC